MSKNLFNNLLKLGNQNPELRNDIKPVLHHLEGKSKTADVGKPQSMKLDLSGFDAPYEMVEQKYGSMVKDFYFEHGGEKNAMTLDDTKGLGGFIIVEYEKDPTLPRPAGFEPDRFASDLEKAMPMVKKVGVFEERDGQLILDF